MRQEPYTSRRALYELPVKGQNRKKAHRVCNALQDAADILYVPVGDNHRRVAAAVFLALSHCGKDEPSDNQRNELRGNIQNSTEQRRHDTRYQLPPAIGQPYENRPRELQKPRKGRTAGRSQDNGILTGKKTQRGGTRAQHTDRQHNAVHRTEQGIPDDIVRRFQRLANILPAARNFDGPDRRIQGKRHRTGLFIQPRRHVRADRPYFLLKTLETVRSNRRPLHKTLRPLPNIRILEA